MKAATASLAGWHRPESGWVFKLALTHRQNAAAAALPAGGPGQGTGCCSSSGRGHALRPLRLWHRLDTSRLAWASDKKLTWTCQWWSSRAQPWRPRQTWRPGPRGCRGSGARHSASASHWPGHGHGNRAARPRRRAQAPGRAAAARLTRRRRRASESPLVLPANCTGSLRLCPSPGPWPGQGCHWQWIAKLGRQALSGKLTFTGLKFKLNWARERDTGMNHSSYTAGAEQHIVFKLIGLFKNFSEGTGNHQVTNFTWIVIISRLPAWVWHC